MAKVVFGKGVNCSYYGKICIRIKGAPPDKGPIVYLKLTLSEMFIKCNSTVAMNPS